MIMKTKVKFQDPYAGLPDERTSRINANVPTEQYKMLQRIRTERGTIQTTTNILLEKLFNELESRGITDFTRVDDFESFVVNCRLTLPTGTSDRSGNPAVRTEDETNGPDDRGGVERGGPAYPATTHVGADVPRSGRVGGKGTSTRGSRSGKKYVE
jgi:hypothetical protein